MEKATQSDKKKIIKKHELAVLAAVFLVGILIGKMVLAGPGGGSSGSQCNDGRDNDGDGRTDYPNDPGCSSKRDSSERGTAICDNGLDDDGDTKVDYPADAGCLSPTDTNELGSTQCDNGVDDSDADSLKDYPNDPGCSSVSDNIEADGQCDDTIDNDGDTQVDYPNDAGCTGFSDSSEYSGYQCDNGLDDDSDSKVDYPYDPGCTGLTDNNEADPIVCGNGACEVGETQTNCPADCGYANSCSDTDFGISYYVQGTASGYYNNQPYSTTGSCYDSTTLVENYCSGAFKYNLYYNCNEVGNSTNSTGTTICSQGACI